MNIVNMDIVKRSGETVLFDSNKILNAVKKALENSQEINNIETNSQMITDKVLSSLDNTKYTVEEIQDKVETCLMRNHFYKTARCYILYREEHSKNRVPTVDKNVQDVFDESSKYFDNDTMRAFVFLRTYSRWLKDENRRESWVETISRFMNFMKENLGDKLTNSEYDEIENAIKKQEVMPSMRLLQFSGVAARRCNATVYNCSYTAPENFKDLADIAYLLMSGCGVGFSVESVHVDKFPVVKIQKNPEVIHEYTIEDSKEAWCEAFLFGLKTWYEGEDVKFDYSKLRPCGAPLKIMGGRSSGPQPLIDLMEFTRTTIFKCMGMKLTNLQMYDIICKIGQIVVSGGIRRCIAEGSKVLVKDQSYKNIEDMKVGDEVLTDDGWKPVVNFFNQGEQETIDIYYQGGKLTCTRNHRLAVFNNIYGEYVWKEAWELSDKDNLGFPFKDKKLKRVIDDFDYYEGKGRIHLVPIEYITKLNDLRQTYDIEVQDNHNFVCEGILVHNSAMISLSDLHDKEVRDAKSGMFWNNNPQRSMANNSAAYNIKPSMTDFMREWLCLAESGTGERGIFNRAGLEKILPKRRIDVIGKEAVKTLGCNPCGEILIQPNGFCNLSEVVCRSEDDVESLLRKARIATIIGTYQSTLTNFKFISPQWKINQELERLLGVSLTGQYDCESVRKIETLQKLKQCCLDTNVEFAKRFGVNPSTSITTTKPSGTVSQLVNSSSGIHPRFSKYYIRRIRISASDPLFKLMKDQGFNYNPEVGQDEENATTFVLDFPVKSPDGSICVDDINALEQLEYWKTVKLNYVEHNSSVTIYIKEDEWLKIGQWIWDNWEICSGLSFLPYSDHIYKLAPYSSITKEEYEKLVLKMNPVDFSKLVNYEKIDNTDVKREMVCTGDKCELN